MGPLATAGPRPSGPVHLPAAALEQVEEAAAVADADGEGDRAAGTIAADEPDGTPSSTSADSGSNRSSRRVGPTVRRVRRYTSDGPSTSIRPTPRQGNHSKRTIDGGKTPTRPDRKSTRLNSSHVAISYAVFCLKKKKSD